MTLFGYGFIVVVAFSLYISYRICKRFNGESSFFLSGLIFLLLICITVPVYIISANSVRNSVDVLSGERYEATVVDCIVSESRGGRGRTTVRKNYYYPIVEFTDNSGNVVRKELNRGSDAPPRTGEVIAVASRPGSAVVCDMSAARSPVTLFLFLLQSVLLAALFYLTCYGFGVEKAVNKRRTKWLLSICIFAGVCLYAANLFFPV